MLDPTALEPIEMTMWEASPPSGLRCVPLLDVQPEPMSTSSRWPLPSLSRTARQRFPSSLRVKLTPEAVLPLLPLSPPPTWLPALWLPAVLVVEPLDAVRKIDPVDEPPVDGPATVAGPALPPDPVPAAVPPVEAGDVCGAAVCGAGVELSPFEFDDVLTEVEPAVVGVDVLLVSDVTTAWPAGLGATVVAVLLADWRTANDGLEPPLPLGGTVVAGAGATVVLVVAGAAVVGGVAVATGAGALLATVPWVPLAPADPVVGAVSAEAGWLFRTRKRPARSAKDAAHLRGLTASILGGVLIRLNEPPQLTGCAGGVTPPQGRGRFNTVPTRAASIVLARFGPLTCTFAPVGSCWTDQRILLECGLLRSCG